MDTFTLEIWDDERKRVTFYTVCKDGATKSETDRFFFKYLQDAVHRQAANDLLALLLQQMGDQHGALDEFFNRDEQAVFSLPPKGLYGIQTVSIHFDDYPLRLYALRIPGRTDIVVLMGGGSKLDVATGRISGAHQKIKGLSLKFSEAQTYAQKIIEALTAGMIYVDAQTRTLKSWDGAEELIF